MPRADEANELQNHDQRAGRGLRQSQSVEHFRRAEPIIILDRLLRHVWQYCVRAPECDHGRFAEKQALLGDGVVPAKQRDCGNDRRNPQSRGYGRHLKRAGPGRPRMFERRYRVVSAVRDYEELARPDFPANEPNERGR
jgi:hypothetical protein